MLKREKNEAKDVVTTLVESVLSMQKALCGFHPQHRLIQTW